MWFLERYRGTNVLRKHEFDPRTDEVDPVTHVVTGATGEVLGVVEGDPTDYNQMRVDLAHITAIRGMLGQVVADSSAELQEYEDAHVSLKAQLYVQYYRSIKEGHIDGKPSDEGVYNWVRQDGLYKASLDNIRNAKNAYYKFANIHSDLGDMENSIKKILEYGKDQ